MYGLFGVLRFYSASCAVHLVSVQQENQEISKGRPKVTAGEMDDLIGRQIQVNKTMARLQEFYIDQTTFPKA